MGQIVVRDGCEGQGNDSCLLITGNWRLVINLSCYLEMEVQEGLC